MTLDKEPQGTLDKSSTKIEADTVEADTVSANTVKNK